MTALGAVATGNPATGPIAHPQEWPVYGDAARAEVDALVAAGRTFDYGYGPELARFERGFADRHRRAHALALGSGTACLFAAFSALGFGPGDEVIVSDYTFFSTATPLLLLGVVPVLADVDPVTGCVAAAEVAALVTSRTAGVVLTHLWGHPCAVDEVRAVADRHGLAMVEDCSHAHGAVHHGRPVGGAGDIAVFSTGGHKAVSGGLGGVLLTDDADLYARACLMASFRHRTDLTIDSPAYQPFLEAGLGGNFRMSTLAAVLADSHLTELTDRVLARQRNMTALLDAIAGLPGLAAVPVPDDCTTGAWYDGVVACGPDAPLSRDDAVRALVAEGLRVRAPATRPVHLYPVFTGSAPEWSPLAGPAARQAAIANDRPFPNAERLHAEWIRLPVNFLWDEAGVIVAPYADAVHRVWARAGAR